MRKTKTSSAPLRRAVFLDRDGVLNQAIVRQGRPYPPGTLGEFKILAGVEQACQALKAAGFMLIVVTNQPDIARGKTAPGDVEAINSRLAALLPLDEIAVCPHDDRDNCACRKPKPGLLFAAAERHGIDLACSAMVGDRWRDIAAGRAAGCLTVFIDYAYDEQRPDAPDHVTTSLAESVPFLIAKLEPQRVPHVVS